MSSLRRRRSLINGAGEGFSGARIIIKVNEPLPCYALSLSLSLSFQSQASPRAAYSPRCFVVVFGYNNNTYAVDS